MLSYKNTFAILSIPLIIAIFLSSADIYTSLIKNIKITFPFISGFIFYITIHIKWHSKVEYLYTFSHEISHAISGLLQGIKVKKIKVKKNSGYVVFKGKPNFITELSPYFIPFYALFIAFLYFSISIFIKIEDYKILFIFFEGFFLSFHIINTIEIMSGIIQSDFKKAGGILFSYTFIVLINILSIILILKILFPKIINFSFFIKKSIIYFKKILIIIFSLFKLFYNTAKIYI